MTIAPPNHDRLIVALDFASSHEATALVEKLGNTVTFYKVGLELLFSGGLELAKVLKTQGKHVFLDMKLLDISNTVEKAVANIAGFGFDFLTIHGTDKKTMDAAVKGRANSDLKLLAVTVLTSLDQNDIAQQGCNLSPHELVLLRAKMARDCGIDGVVASGLEASDIRAEVGPNMAIVTPGIRLSDGQVDDQKRVMTPERAIAAGASHLVVGRPITQAENPVQAAERFQSQIAAV